MTKQEFIAALRQRLHGLPQRDIEERLSFYGEMIDDHIEDGQEEAEAVAAIGSGEEIASQIIADTPFARIAKERIRPKRRLRGGEIALLVLGSPLWLSLVIAAFAVVLSVWVTLWAAVASVWAVFASVAAYGPAGILMGAIIALGGKGASGVALIGAGLVCGGLAILLFFGCRAATSGCVLLTKSIALGIKKCFVGKEKTV